MQPKPHRHVKKATAFHTGAGIPNRTPVAFHTSAKFIPTSQTGSRAVGATTVFNKTDTTGGAFSIGTPLSGPQSHGKFRRMGLKRGF